MPGSTRRRSQDLQTDSGITEWLAERPRFLRQSIRLDGPQNALLYLADDLPGPFTAAEEHLAAGIADAAATAIANARLYQAAKQDHRWAEAAAELNHDLVSGAAESPLDLVLRHATRAAEADLAAVLVPEDGPRSGCTPSSAGWMACRTGSCSRVRTARPPMS